MFKLKFKKLIYRILKIILRAKSEVYEVLIMDIDEKLKEMEEK